MNARKIRKVLLELDDDEVADLVDTIRNPKYDGVWILRELAEKIDAAKWS